MTKMLWGLSAALAVYYGFVLTGMGPHFTRTAVKVASTLLLAVIAYLSGAPILLVAALALSAVGDGFLAEDDYWLRPGMAAFLAAHVAYAVLFFQLGTAETLLGWRGAILLLAALVAVGVLKWLWGVLIPLRAAVSVYMVGILVMVAASLTLPGALWPATIGAMLFLTSDALLAGEMFRGAKILNSTRLTDWAVWFLYYAAQSAILAAFVL